MSARTVREAAQQAKVRLATLYKWQKLPIFINELNRMREEVLEDVVSTLKTTSLRAVNTLAHLMDNSKSELVRRGSATDILTHCKAFIDLKDLTSRLESLEQQILTSNKDRGGSYVYKG